MLIPKFTNKSDTYDFLRSNKEQLYASKRSTIKYADGLFSIGESSYDDIVTASKSFIANKEEIQDVTSPKAIDLKLAINATNFYDTHSDVHIPGIWNKSLKEKKVRFLLQEHEMEFKKIIADSVNDGLIASVEQMTFKQLGFKYDGMTEVLVYSCKAKKDRNEYMVNEYLKGHVLNHSVGMMYVKLLLCMNSESNYDVDEKANWDKYYPMIANKSDVDPVGWFWAVLEAKEIEGSAVPLGSCKTTPVISISEPSDDTQGKQIQNEPHKSTQLNPESIKSLLINF